MTIVESGDGAIATQGLNAACGVELELNAVPPALVAAASALLRDLAAYAERTPRTLLAGERVDWGSSLLILRESGPARLTLDELDFDGATVVPGVENALGIWTSQTELCRSHHVDYTSTFFGSKVAISPGLLESSAPVEGIRYAAEGSMSGWWLFLADYDGTGDEFRSMRPTHVFHVLAARRDLARYFALPEGYAFETASGVVWRDTTDAPGG